MATILPASHADKIQWLNDNPVWVDQWYLFKEKIEATSSLVQEQLEALRYHRILQYLLSRKNPVNGDCYKF